MKIYTKTGDRGSTGLFDGKRVEKDDIRIEAYGTSDELNAFVGVLREHLRLTQAPSMQLLVDQLERVQNELFDVGAELANPSHHSQANAAGIDTKAIERLENEIDMMTKELPPLRQFVLPGGHIANSYAHVCRTVCRRAERLVVTLRRHDESQRDAVLVYLNRLSDWFFTVSRWISFTLKAEEIKWSAKRGT